MRCERNRNSVTEFFANGCGGLRIFLEQRRGWYYLDHNTRRVFVTIDTRIGLPIDEWVVTVRQLNRAHQVRLIGNHGATEKPGFEHDIELDQDFAVRWQIHAADVDHSGAVGPAERIRIARIRARRNRSRDERQRTRHENRRGIHRAKIIDKREVGETTICCLQTQGVTQRIARCCYGGGIDTGR